MTKRNLYLLSGTCLLINGALLSQGCVASGHPAGPSTWGQTAPSSRLEAMLDQPGPLEVESIASATWQVPLDGMLNLEHPKAKAAGLTDGEQPIAIYFHALRHPTRGLFIVDTGVERAFTQDPEHALVRGFMAKAAKIDSIVVKVDLASWLSRQPQPLAGVLLTHMHLDHIMGM